MSEILPPKVAHWLPDVLTWKRLIRCCLAIVLCVVLTLLEPTRKFLGPNVFLVGTVAIYLFPKSTVGAQLLNTIIAYSGFLLGLAWYNFFQRIALLIPSPGNRIWIFMAFIAGAWICGLVRSLYPICYLGMNFFMLVNIFGLVVAIELDQHDSRTFSDFFYVFTFGTLIAFLFALCWPENTSSSIEASLVRLFGNLVDAVADLDQVEDLQNGLRHYSSIQAQNNALRLQLEASRYEFLWTRLNHESMVRILGSTEQILASLHTCELISIALQKSSKAHIPNTIAPVQALEAHAKKLMIDQLKSIKSDLIAAIAGTTHSADLEKVHASSVSSHASVRQILQEHLQMNVGGVEEDDRIALHSQLLDTLICMSLTLSSLGLVVEDMCRTCHGRRRVRLPACLLKHKAHMPYQPGQRRGSAVSVMSVDVDKVPRLQYWRLRLAHSVTVFRDSRHSRYALKFALGVCMLSIWPFIDDWRTWYADVRGHWSIIFFLVCMEITRGFVFRSAVLKGIGSFCGGLLAVAVYSLGTVDDMNSIPLMACLTLCCMLFIFKIALHPRFGKAGLVAALAFNLVLGVGASTDKPWVAFLKRTATQFTGILVACIITVLFSPYHARRELKNELELALDDLASCFQESVYDRDRNLSLEDSMRKKLRYAQELLRYTKFEPSLRGRFPSEVFEEIIEDTSALADLLLNRQTYVEQMTLMGILPAKDVGASDSHCAAVAKDLYLLSHALGNKAHNVAELATTLTLHLSNSSDPSVACWSIALNARMMNSLIERLRRKIWQVISGRSLPGQLLQVLRPKASLVACPSPSVSHSRRGSTAFASPLQTLVLPAALLSPATVVIGRRRSLV